MLKTNRILLGLFGVAVTGAISYGSCDFVSAYSASITTGGAIELTVSANGDGTSIQADSINVVSDCRNGYNLTVATPEGSSLYKYENDTQAGTASFSAVDGTSALNNSNNTNKWGYTLTSNPTSSTVFSPLSSTPSSLKTSSQTASPSSDINDSFSVYYGIQTDSSVEPGLYKMANSGSIVYYLTMDTSCTQYTVTFNANGGTGTMASQGIDVGEPTRLSSADSLTAPTGASYTDAANNTINGNADKLWTFWGWNTEIDGTGDWYKDREAVENLESAGNTITLYAQWKQATLADMVAGTQVGTEKIINHNEMQDMRPEVCYNSDITTAANAPAATLLDYRGKVTTGESPESPESYTVSKLADSNCWMTKNLNLGRDSGGPNGDGTITLTSDDTDLDDNTTFTLPAADTTSYTATTRLPRIRLTNNSGTNTNGVYYTWSAVVTNTNSITTSPTTSICPKNWDLPNAATYTNLKVKADYKSGNLTTSAPSSFLINGGYTNGATFYGTAFSYYWTNRSHSATIAYTAKISGANIDVGNATGANGYASNKYYRNSVRCIASNGTATINYDGNGTTEYPAAGTTATQANVEINSVSTQVNGFTRTGWIFNGWNTAPDGSGTSIAASTAIPNLQIRPGGAITLYAQWIPQYTINYIHNCKTWAAGDANCTDVKSVMTSSQTFNLDASGNGSATLKNYNAWTNLSGWKVKEWTTNPDGTGTVYPINSTYSVTGANPGDSITLYAHWVPIYSVQYDGNGSDNDSTGMGSTDSSTGLKSVRHTDVGEGDTFDLFASNFKKAGYGFVGWSTDQNAWAKLTDNDTSNDAKIWGPNEVITAPAYNGTPITTLYAVWAPAETSGGNPVYLQGWTGCSTMAATTYNSSTGTLTVAKDSITALTDERDGNVYAIAKLADDNCWMIENLRLADTHDENGNTVATTLTTSNTNIDTNNNTLPITNIYNADSSLATKSNSLSPSSSQNSTDDTSYGWCTNQNAACYDQSRLNTTNTAADITPSQTQNITSANAHSNFSTTVYAYGNYYNWYSATAGYGTYSRTTSAPTDGDLCPAGWKLPYGSSGASGTDIGDTKGGFYYLANQMGATSNNQVNSNKFRMFPNNFIYSGTWRGGSANNRGFNGYYWSASAGNSSSVYTLYLNKDNINPGNVSNNKYSGSSVRCVFGS